MTIFDWNDADSVHVARFDEQHQKLFAIVNTLAEAIPAGKDQQVIMEVVSQLAVYTRVHFLQEEVLMRRTSYPGLVVHKQEHSGFMAQIEKYKSDLFAGRALNNAEVLAFLSRWLTEHVCNSDQAYSSHMNAHGIR